MTPHKMNHSNQSPKGDQKSVSKSAYHKKYYTENRERILARQKRWRTENAEIINAHLKAKHEQIKRTQRAYRKKTKERVNSYRRKYYKNNRERINAYWRRYYTMNKERINQRLCIKKKEAETGQNVTTLCGLSADGTWDQESEKVQGNTNPVPSDHSIKLST